MPSSARAFGRHKTADEQLAARLLIRFWRDLPIYVFRCGFGPVISWLQGDGAMGRAHVPA